MGIFKQILGLWEGLRSRVTNNWQVVRILVLCGTLYVAFRGVRLLVRMSGFNLNVSSGVNFKKYRVCFRALS